MSLQMALFDSLLWLSNSPSCMFPTSSYYSSVDGHLGRFHVLVIINSPDMNVGVHISFWIKVSVPSRYKPSSRVAGSCVNSIFRFLRNLHTGYMQEPGGKDFCHLLGCLTHSTLLLSPWEAWAPQWQYGGVQPCWPMRDMGPEWKTYIFGFGGEHFFL